jgi:oligogalacturonide lyase
MYFTEDGFWDQSRQLLLACDRGANWNIFSYQMDTGKLHQLTDFPAGASVDIHGALHRGVEKFYCWYGSTLTAVSLRTGATCDLWQVPEGFIPGMVGADADGRRVWVAITQRPADASRQAYANYRQRYAARPRSQLWMIATDTGRADMVHEEQAWFTHVNPSPTQSGLVLFCHEGPWDLVQRMWVRNESGQISPLRPRDGVWGVGHEFWCADGETVGYHARCIGDDRRHMVGFHHARSGQIVCAGEIDIPTQHAQANTPQRVILDSVRSQGDRLHIIERVGQVWSPSRILCVHDTSRHSHHSHAHPRFSPDGRWVVFTSDRLGYSDVWMVEVPATLDVLPLASAYPPSRFYWM